MPDLIFDFEFAGKRAGARFFGSRGSRGSRGSMIDIEEKENLQAQENMNVDEGTDPEDSEEEDQVTQQRGRRSLRVRNKPDNYVAIPASGTCAEGKIAKRG